MNACLLHSQSGGNLEKGRSKGTHAFCKRLCFQFFDFLFGEGIAFPGKVAEGTYFLVAMI